MRQAHFARPQNCIQHFIKLFTFDIKNSTNEARKERKKDRLVNRGS